MFDVDMFEAHQMLAVINYWIICAILTTLPRNVIAMQSFNDEKMHCSLLFEERGCYLEEKKTLFCLSGAV